MNAQVVTLDPMTILRNRCYLRLLERIALRFNQRGIPLMALKGAALQVSMPGRRPDRPMCDLDLMVKPDHLDEARSILGDMKFRQGRPFVRGDFFPKYHYETEFTSHSIVPMKIDLHVRPFRPLRYARLIPDDAFWNDAIATPIGAATVLAPSAGDMLMHLCVHAAIHGFSHDKWLGDIRDWIESKGREIDWDRLVLHAKSWRLALPLATALGRVDEEHSRGRLCHNVDGLCYNADGESLIPARIRSALQEAPLNWRDRLALWHAPHDASHPVRHTVTTVASTPGIRFAAGYLVAQILPDREHMEQWYGRRHPMWLPIAHVTRWLWPMLRCFPKIGAKIGLVQFGERHGTRLAVVR